jgi:hypothetical protein
MRLRPAESHPLALALASVTHNVPVTGVSGVIGWWERRRPLYNAAVGIVGLVTMALLGVAFAASRLTARPWAVPDPAIGVPFLVVFYGIAANVCYTGGWFTQLALRAAGGDRDGSFAPWAFRAGLIFSVALTLLPGLFGIIALLVSLCWR